MVLNPLNAMSFDDSELAHRRQWRNISQQSGLSSETVRVLQGLIEACSHSEASFHAGATAIRDGEIGALLDKLAIQHSEFAQELQNVLERFGEVISVTDTSRRGREAGKTDDIKQDDCTILGECEAIDAVTFQKYSVAYETNLPETAHGVIANQYFALKTAHEKLQRLVIVMFDTQTPVHSRRKSIPKSKP